MYVPYYHIHNELLFVHIMTCQATRHYLSPLLTFVAGASCPYQGTVSFTTLQWCHNELDGISNHQPQDYLLNRLFGHRSKKTSKLCVTGLCVGNSSGTGEFPAQMASNVENVSIWWRHHDLGAGQNRMHVRIWYFLIYFLQMIYMMSYDFAMPQWVQLHEARHESDMKAIKFHWGTFCKGMVTLIHIINKKSGWEKTPCKVYEVYWKVNVDEG